MTVSILLFFPPGWFSLCRRLGFCLFEWLASLPLHFDLCVSIWFSPLALLFSTACFWFVSLVVPVYPFPSASAAVRLGCVFRSVFLAYLVPAGWSSSSLLSAAVAHHIFLAILSFPFVLVQVSHPSFLRASLVFFLFSLVVASAVSIVIGRDISSDAVAILLRCLSFREVPLSVALWAYLLCVVAGVFRCASFLPAAQVLCV